MIYKSKNKTYYICHSHQFDIVNTKLGISAYISFLIGNFIHLINRVYNKIRGKAGFSYHSLITPIKQITHKIIGGSKILKKGLKQIIQEKKCNGIIYAHTHLAENKLIGNIHYLNSGERIEHCSALAEDTKGNRKIIYYKE